MLAGFSVEALQRAYDAGRRTYMTEKILQLEKRDAAVAASLSKEGRPVTEAEVRGGAARSVSPLVVRNTASRRSAIRPCSRVSR